MDFFTKFGLMSRVGPRGRHLECRPKMIINKYILHFEPNLEPYNIQKKKTERAAGNG